MLMVGAAAAAVVLGTLVYGVTLDRIAVTVGSQVITLRDVEREVRVTSFLNGVKPDLSPANKRATAERMVEQKLVRAELESSRFPIPAPSEVDPALEKFRKDDFPTDADYQHALEQYGITGQDVRDLLLWQRTLLQFISLRFQPGVRVTDQQIQEYFDRVVAPAARAAHPAQPPALEDFRSQIEQTLIGRQADREMDNWLREARKRTEIVFHPEALQ